MNDELAAVWQNNPRKPGDNLRAYIADARATLGLTPPEYDDLYVIDDAFVSLAVLEAILDVVQPALDDEFEVRTAAKFDYGHGYVAAVLNTVVAAEDQLKSKQLERFRGDSK